MKSVLEPSYQLLVSHYVRKQAKQLSSQFAGIRRGEDIEYVHRARVACRRLRAGLQMSRKDLNKQQFKSWRKEIRMLLKRLGDARDKDVQTEFLWAILSGLQDRALLPGVARIAVGWEQARERLQPAVIAAVEHAESRGVVDEMLAASSEKVAELERRKVRLLGREFFTRLEERISERLDAFVEHEECLAEAHNEEAHHEMRIAAKQLRYTLEICRRAYAGQLDDYLATVKKIQSYLGEIHDCDVWNEHLSMALGEEGKRLAENYGHVGLLGRLTKGIEHLRSERFETRQRLFRDLNGYWQELEQEEYWERLRKLIGSCALDGEVSPRECEGGSSECDDESEPTAERAAGDSDPQQPAVQTSSKDWT